MRALLVQRQEGTMKEVAIYYLSKMLLDYETKYTLLECTCVPLVYTTKKLRNYLLAHTTHLISILDPIKYLFENLIFSERLGPWHALLSKFYI